MWRKYGNSAENNGETKTVTLEHTPNWRSVLLFLVRYLFVSYGAAVVRDFAVLEKCIINCRI